MSTVVEEFVAKLGWDIDSKELRTFQAQARGLKDTARTAFYGAAAAATFLGAAIWKVSKAFSVIEDAEAAFTPLLGGAKRAGDMVERLNTLAAKTPFEFQDLAGTAKQLLPLMDGDIQRTIDLTQMLGDAAGGNAQKMASVVRGYTRVLMIGKANRESLNIISEAQVPIYAQLTKVLGYANNAKMFDALSAGKISAEDVTKTFKAMTSEGGIYFRGMEIASRTLSGKLSTLSDDATMAMAAIGEQLSPVLKDLVDDASGVAQSVRAWAKANGALIRTKFAEYVRDIRDFIAGVVSFGKGLKSVIDRVGGFGNAFKIVAGVFVGIKLVPFLTTLNSIVSAAPSLGSAFASAGRTALVSWGAMGATLGAMYLIIDDIVVGLKGGESYTGDMSKSMTGVLQDFVAWRAEVNGMSADSLTYQLSQTPLFQRGLWETIKVGWTETDKLIADGMSSLGARLVNLGKLIWDSTLGHLWKSIYEGIGLIGNVLGIGGESKIATGLGIDVANLKKDEKTGLYVRKPGAELPVQPSSKFASGSAGGIISRGVESTSKKLQKHSILGVAPAFEINISGVEMSQAKIKTAVQNAVEKALQSVVDNMVSEEEVAF